MNEHIDHLMSWVHDTMPGLGPILVLVVVLYLLWTLIGGKS